MQAPPLQRAPVEADSKGMQQVTCTVRILSALNASHQRFIQRHIHVKASYKLSERLIRSHRCTFPRRIGVDVSAELSGIHHQAYGVGHLVEYAHEPASANRAIGLARDSERQQLLNLGGSLHRQAREVRRRVQALDAE